MRISSLVILFCSWPLFAGFVPISQLIPYVDGQRTPRISGLAFDAYPNPWIIDGLSWQMRRLDISNGSVLETYSPIPDTLYNDSLAWSSQTGLFYTANQFFLYSIALGNRTVVGPFQLFNFTSLAFDPAGNLWLGADNGGGQLWRVDTATGALSFVTGIAGLSGPLTALSINGAGGFFVAAGDGAFYHIDPVTGQAVFLTTAALGPLNFIVDFESDPASGRWFGVESQRTTGAFYFGEITGIEVQNVPEPGSAAILAALLAVACARRQITGKR